MPIITPRPCSGRSLVEQRARRAQMMLRDRLSKGSSFPPGVALAILALAAFTLAVTGAPADAAAPSSVVISYPDFSSGAPGLQRNGVATLAESALRLTPAQPQTRASAFSRTEFQPGGSFATEFELYMHDGTEPPADGVAFVLQPGSAEALGKAGGAMGYQGLEPSVEVEFDLFRDFAAPEMPTDPPVPNVSLMVNGDPVHHLATSAEPLPFPLIEEHVWAWVEYDAETTELSVFANTVQMKPASPLFAPYKIDLPALLGEYSYAGFTSGTGQFDAVQEVLDWQLSSELPTRFVPPPASPAPSAPTTTTTTAPSLHATSTQVLCALVVSSAQNTCTASVADVAVSGASNPTGSLGFASAAGGSFGAGGSCVLAPVPSTANVSSCAAQFIAPTGVSSPSSITATYGGDASHAASVGAGAYVPSRELGKDVSFSPSVTLSADGKQADVTFFCHFACSVLGELTSGSNFAAETATVKRVPLGKGVLKLGRPAKGELRVALSSKARKALAKAAGRPVKGILEITVYTASGTLVKRERKTVTIRPRAGKATATRG